MYSVFQLALKYIRYYSTASNGKGHGTHSPFVYDFIRRVLNDREIYPAYEKVEGLRHSLRKDMRLLDIADYGAGSVDGSHSKRSIASIASRAAKPAKYGQILYRMVKYYGPSNILELGTSLGITTAYLALANETAHVTTIEGDKNIAAVASHNFNGLGIKNITLVNEPFDDCLESILRQKENIDLVFIDGNHRFEPTYRYFIQLLAHIKNGSVMVFDDIHWSSEMETAWKKIKEHPAVMLTIDLFFIGLVFFREENKVKQHFTIRF